MEVDIYQKDRSANQAVAEVTQIREFIKEQFISHIVFLVGRWMVDAEEMKTLLG